MLKRIFSILLIGIFLLPVNDQALANTIIDQSTDNLGHGERVKYTRSITVPKGAYLGIYFDSKSTNGGDYFVVYSSGDGQVAYTGTSDYNKVLGVPAGTYTMMLECYSSDLTCNSTGSISAQYK